VNVVESAGEELIDDVGDNGFSTEGQQEFLNAHSA
jgi:hypothetical protein